jgi:hypothetical protein
VFRVGTHEGRVYVAMELVEGGTLRRKKRELRPWRVRFGPTAVPR